MSKAINAATGKSLKNPLAGGKVNTPKDSHHNKLGSPLSGNPLSKKMKK